MFKSVKFYLAPRDIKWDPLKKMLTSIYHYILKVHGTLVESTASNLKLSRWRYHFFSLVILLYLNKKRPRRPEWDSSKLVRKKTMTMTLN